MVNKTIGVGGDYADFGAAWNSIVGTTLTDDYTFTIISAFTETTGVTNVGPTFNGHSVTFIDNGGHIITSNGLLSFFDDGAAATTNDRFSFIGITLKRTANVAASLGMLRANVQYAGRGMSVLVKNCKFISSGTAIGGTGYDCNSVGSWANITHIINCVFYNLAVGIDVTNIETNSTGSDHKIENCVVYNCATGIKLNNNNVSTRFWQFRNTVSFGNTTADWTAGSQYNQISNCADDDNTISASGAVIANCITGVTTGDFLSVNPDAANFFHINNTSKLWETGTPSISSDNTADIAGNARPHPVNKANIGIYESNPTVTVRFTDASTGTPDSYDLDFGDGSAHATSLPVDHIYDPAAIGTPYVVTAVLTVTTGAFTKSISKNIELFPGELAQILDYADGLYVDNTEGVIQ